MLNLQHLSKLRMNLSRNYSGIECHSFWNVSCACKIIEGNLVMYCKTSLEKVPDMLYVIYVTRNCRPSHVINVFFSRKALQKPLYEEINDNAHDEEARNKSICKQKHMRQKNLSPTAAKNDWIYFIDETIRTTTKHDTSPNENSGTYKTGVFVMLLERRFHTSRFIRQTKSFFIRNEYSTHISCVHFLFHWHNRNGSLW